MDSKTLHDLAIEAVEATMRLETLANAIAESVDSHVISKMATEFFDAAILIAKFSVVADRMGIGNVPYECDEAAFRAAMDGIYEEINGDVDRYLAEHGGGEDE